MSADMENGKEEGEEQEKEQEVRKTWKSRLVYHWPVVFKIFELIICATCFGLSTTTIAVQIVELHNPLKSTVMVLPAAYTVLTFFNIMASTTNIPHLWRFWLPIALLAAMLFFVCTGCLLSANTATGYYEMFLIAYGFAGFVFLFDVAETARLQCFYEEIVPPLRHAHFPEQEDKSVQVEIETEDVKSTLEHAEHVDDSRTHDYGETKKFKRRATPAVPSHGGTFHVSKNIVPLSTMRSEEDFDRSCDSHHHPTGVGIKTEAEPRRTSKSCIKKPHATYQLKCMDSECPCNTDEYIYGVQSRQLATMSRSTSGGRVSRQKYSALSCPTSNSTSDQHSPISDNECECTTPSFATNYSSSVERAIVFQTFNQNSGSGWGSNSWAPVAHRSCTILPGAVVDTRQSTTMNIERCITIKEAGSYRVSPPLTSNRPLSRGRIARRGTRCTQM